MKTLKHLALVALVCFGASAFAGATEAKQIADLKLKLQAAKQLKAQGNPKAAATASAVATESEELMGANLTDAQMDAVIDINTEATQIAATSNLL